MYLAKTFFSSSKEKSKQALAPLHIFEPNDDCIADFLFYTVTNDRTKDDSTTRYLDEIRVDDQ
jgi:hypothetical protein